MRLQERLSFVCLLYELLLQFGEEKNLSSLQVKNNFFYLVAFFSLAEKV